MSVADATDIVEREGLGLAIIEARKGVDSAAIGKALGLALQDRPGRVGDGRLAAIGTGPGVWLLIAEDAPDDWAEALAVKLKGLAAVFDQSSGYIVLRVTGRDARRALQSGVSIDLDPSEFKVNSAASTSIAHIGVLLWQVQDDGYDLAFYRSYRGSLEHWLADTIAAL